MIPTTIVRALVSLLGVLGSGLLGAAGAADANPVELTMSYYHYCARSTCSPADQSYVRIDSGPVAGSDNPASIVDVHVGGTVRWVYRDVGPGSCDFFGERCPGHNVVFEDGTEKGTTIGFAKGGKGETSITATITQQPGTLIRYFCSINKHYQTGMTGILRVAAPAG